MKPNFNIEKLEKMLKSFYVLTHVRIVIYDNNFNEIVSYPHNDCDFCRQIRLNKLGEIKCQQSNLEAFKNCYQSEDLYIYKCHAGLVEAMIHLRIKDIIVGYIMFGQISDIKDDEQRFLYLCKANKFNENDEKIKEYIQKIKHLSEDELQASSTILLSLAKYAVSERLVSVRKEKFTSDLEQYLEEHLSDSEIRINDLSKYLHMSRTNLYNAAEKYLGMGIARFIKLYRIEKAKTLLIESDDSITEIAYKVGFSDYNYFCRVFKSEVGKSAKRFKEEFNK